MTVAASWHRITSWCARHAPATAATIAPPADAAQIAEVERGFPRPWPDDLRAWYLVQNGTTSHTMFATLLTCWDVLPLSGIVDQQRMYLDIYAEYMDELGPDGESQAGEPVATWLPEFVPIGDDHTGCALFVDTRPGPHTGCVTGFMREDAAAEPSWPSVTAMLDDLATALETGQSCDGWVPSVRDGVVEWEPD